MTTIVVTEIRLHVMRLSLLCPTPPSRGIGGAPVVELLVILALGVGHFPAFDRNTFKSR